MVIAVLVKINNAYMMNQDITSKHELLLNSKINRYLKNCSKVKSLFPSLPNK